MDIAEFAVLCLVLTIMALAMRGREAARERSLEHIDKAND